MRQDFEKLVGVDVAVPAGEPAYWTLPRESGSWRLPADSTGSRDNDRLIMLPVRDDSYKSNAYLAVIPQPMIMHKKVSKMLEDYAWRLFRHYPVENSLARREHGVPMLIGRFDVIVDQNGGVQICELDDVCSLWPAMAQINPITETYLRALEHQLGQSIYTAELFQYADWPLDASPRVRKEFCRIWFFEDDGKRIPAYVPRADSFRMAILKNDGLNWRRSQSNTDRNAEYYERILQRFYLHNEDHWRGDINDAWLLKGEKFRLDEVALSVRAHRGMPGFQEHMDRYGSRSITMAWERDSKWSLVAEKLAVLAADLEVAVAFAKEWQADHPDALLVFKTLYGARTEGTAIFSSKGTKLKGVSSASQIRRKFGDAAQEPIVIQPYKEPDHLATAKVNFIGAAEENDRDIYTDRSLIRSVEHMGSSSPGERVVAGMESHFPMIFRSFVVYLPHEKRLVNIGGLWQATDGRIVHGGAHSVAGPLYVDGLVGHPDGRRSVGLDQAEAMIRSKYLELVG